MKKNTLLHIGFTLGIAIQASASPLSRVDQEIVATCMVLEAGCDGVEGMQAVLNVILTRADGYLENLVKVTTKKSAFSSMAAVWNSETPNYAPLIRKARAQGEVYTYALQLIDIMQQGELRDNTYGANHFHATYMHPYWAGSMYYITTIGGHHFYSDQPQAIAL